MENAVEKHKCETCDNDKCQRCKSRIQRNESKFQIKSSKIGKKPAGDQIKRRTRTDGDYLLQISLITSYYMNVNSKLAERIIGIEGCQIQRLQKNSGAEIMVIKEKSASNGTTLRITGTVEARKKAIKLIEDMAKEKVSDSPGEIESIRTEREKLFLGSDTANENRDKDRCQRGTSRIQENSSQFQVNKISEVVKKPAEDQIECHTKANNNYLLQPTLKTSYYMNVNSKLAERIIGIEGCQIQHLQKNSGAEIMVIKEKSASNGTTLRITGTVEARKKAIKLIEDMAKEKVSDSPGEIESIRTEREKLFLGSDTANENRDKDRCQRGTSQIQENSSQFQVNKISEVVKKPAEDQIECHTKANNNYLLQPTLKTSYYMNVNSKLAERIIGIEGCQIQHLQKNSGAEIMVIKEKSASNGTILRITGTVEARKKAIKLIDDITNEANEKVSNPPVETASVFMEDEKLHLGSDTAKKNYFASLPPIIRDFYKEDPIVAAMTNQEVDWFRYCNLISVMCENPEHRKRIPKPVTSFKQAFQHYPELLEELIKQGFTSPSRIQCQAWPIIMKGYDMIGVAPAETGKTLAFLLPALIHIIGQATTRENQIGPSVLILASTKKAVKKIYVEAKKYMHFGIKSVCIYGRGNQKYDMKHMDLLITTPEHMYDVDMNNAIRVTGVTFLVLDNADQMLKFQSQICKLASDIHPNRQIVAICTANRAWKRKMEKLLSCFMIKPISVLVK